MTNFCKYDVIVVRFPFASSIKYKARPAVIVSSNTYNENSRDTLLILAVSSSILNKLDFELEIKNWREAGLLKPSLFKSSVATVEKDSVIKKLGRLKKEDIYRLDELIKIIC